MKKVNKVTKRKKQVRLPNKLSALLELALGDLRECEVDDRYTIDMSVWHKPNGGCRVCLAGAVLAKHLRVPIYKRASPDLFPTYNNRLLALDALRNGCLGYAADLLSIVLPPGARVRQHWQIYPYGLDPLRFYSDMGHMLQHLKEHGL